MYRRLFNRGYLLRCEVTDELFIEKENRKIILILDNDTLDRYAEFYFQQHPRARKKPIAHPYHPSMNTWCIMPRPRMNALKQIWKDFGVWWMIDQGANQLKLSGCTMCVTTFFNTKRRHDVDNTCPKFLIDGLVEGGLFQDDDEGCVKELVLKTGYDKYNPRTEIEIIVG